MNYHAEISPDQENRFVVVNDDGQIIINCRSMENAEFFAKLLNARENKPKPE